MRLGKKAQYGLLFVLYLARSGRSNTETAAANLGISQHFLEQLARKLKLAGVIGVKRGPGGGYELVGTPELGAVFKALEVNPMLTSTESIGYMQGGVEQRALASIVGTLSRSMADVLKTPVTELGAQLVRDEVTQLNSATETATPN